MTRHRIWIGFAVLAVSVLLTTETQATTQPKFAVGQYKAAAEVRVLSYSEFQRTAKRFGLKVRTVKLSKHDAEKLAKLPAKGCGCALTPDDDFGFGSCFRGCMISWGVNQSTLIACGATCVGAGTGNPVAIALCAACVGTSEWIVAGCSLNCAWRNSFIPEESLVKARAHPSPSRGTRQPKLTPRPAIARS